MVPGNGAIPAYRHPLLAELVDEPLYDGAVVVPINARPSKLFHHPVHGEWGTAHARHNGILEDVHALLGPGLQRNAHRRPFLLFLVYGNYPEITPKRGARQTKL